MPTEYLNTHFVVRVTPRLVDLLSVRQPLLEPLLVCLSAHPKLLWKYSSAILEPPVKVYAAPASAE